MEHFPKYVLIKYVFFKYVKLNFKQKNKSMAVILINLILIVVSLH